MVFFLVSYSVVLRHTVEEVLAACMEAIDPDRARFTSLLQQQVKEDLMNALKNHSWFAGFDIIDEVPMRFSLKDWIKLAKESEATVFLSGRSYNRGTAMFSYLYATSS